LPRLKLNPTVEDLFAFKYEDIEIVDYVADPSIKAQVAV
jgi:thymidylate synthase